MGDENKALSIDIILNLLGQGKVAEATASLQQFKKQAEDAGQKGKEGAGEAELGHRQLAAIVQRLAGNDFPELGHAISHLAFGGTVVGSIYAIVGLIEMVRHSVEAYQEKLHEIEVDSSKAIFLPGIEKKLEIARQVVDALADYQRAIDQQQAAEHNVTAELAEQLVLHAAIRAAQQSQLEAEHTLAVAKLEQDKALGNITPVDAAIQKGEIEKQYLRDKAKAQHDATQQQISDELAAAQAAAKKQDDLVKNKKDADQAVADEKDRQRELDEDLSDFDEKDVAAARIKAGGLTQDELREKLAQNAQDAKDTAGEDPLGFVAAERARLEQQLQAAQTRDEFDKLTVRKTEIARDNPLHGLEAAAAEATKLAEDNNKVRLDADKKAKDLTEQYNGALAARNAALAAQIKAIDAGTQSELGRATGLGPNGNTQERGAQQQGILTLAALADIISRGEAARKDFNEGRVNQSLNPEAFKRNQRDIAAEDAIPQSQKDLVKALGDFSNQHQNTMQQAANIIGKLNDTPDAFLATLTKLVSKAESNDVIARNLLDRVTNLESRGSLPNRGQ